jgi:arsenate reductase (glutaredoxin)
MKAKIYHNPRCSKSRATLALLRERGIELEVVDYIATRLSKAQLRDLLRKLAGPRSRWSAPPSPSFDRTRSGH